MVKRLIVVALLVMFACHVAHAEWVRQTVTSFVPAHYETCYVCVGYVYNPYEDWYYPVYRWVRVWVEGDFITYVRYVWVTR